MKVRLGRNQPNSQQKRELKKQCKKEFFKLKSLPKKATEYIIQKMLASTYVTMVFEIRL